MSQDETTGWQPIETAPKNDVILLSDGGQLWQGFWQEGRGWMTGWRSGPLTVTLEIPATHWQPLLEGPK